MKLTKEESELFFELTFALQFYANSRKEIIPDIRSIEEYHELPQKEKHMVRDALYDSPELIDDYISGNPDKFDEEKLTIISQWKNCIRGDFQIERYLKNYAIFIDEKNNVYGVLALHQGFDELFPKNYLPLYVKTVLLPFKGKIVYDGLMQAYNIRFGGGMKRSLRETYMRAKQNEKIITTFDRDKGSNSKKIANKKAQRKDWSKELKQLKIAAKNLKGGMDQPIINGPVFSLLKASIELANQAVVHSSDVDTLTKELRKVERAASKIETILYRTE